MLRLRHTEERVKTTFRYTTILRLVGKYFKNIVGNFCSHVQNSTGELFHHRRQPTSKRQYRTTNVVSQWQCILQHINNNEHSFELKQCETFNDAVYFMYAIRDTMNNFCTMLLRPEQINYLITQYPYCFSRHTFHKCQCK